MVWRANFACLHFSSIAFLKASILKIHSLVSQNCYWSLFIFMLVYRQQSSQKHRSARQSLGNRLYVSLCQQKFLLSISETSSSFHFTYQMSRFLLLYLSFHPIFAPFQLFLAVLEHRIWQLLSSCQVLVVLYVLGVHSQPNFSSYPLIYQIRSVCSLVFVLLCSFSIEFKIIYNLDCLIE